MFTNTSELDLWLRCRAMKVHKVGIALFGEDIGTVCAYWLPTG